MKKLVALLFVGAACATTPRAPETAAPADDAAIYAAAIDHAAPAGGGVVVIDSTVGPERRAVANSADGAGAELAGSFREANRAARALPRALPSARTVRFARRGELPFASAGANPDLEAQWASFRTRFPGANGYYELSGIGFDASRSTAVVYVGHSCGSVCGTGKLVTLRRAGTGWRVENSQVLWVS